VAVTSVIKEAVISVPYLFRISEAAADFIGRANLGISESVTAYLTGVRPYYLEYTDTSQIALVKGMWNTLVYTDPLLHQFSCTLSSTDPQSVSITFCPAEEITLSTAWDDVYNIAVGHAGNFILSLIIISQHARG